VLIANCIFVKLRHCMCCIIEYFVQISHHANFAQTMCQRKTEIREQCA